MNASLRLWPLQALLPCCGTMQLDCCTACRVYGLILLLKHSAAIPICFLQIHPRWSLTIHMKCGLTATQKLFWSPSGWPTGAAWCGMSDQQTVGSCFEVRQIQIEILEDLPRSTDLRMIHTYLASGANSWQPTKKVFKKSWDETPASARISSKQET